MRMNNKHYGWALVVLVLVFAGAAIVAYQKNQKRAAAIPVASTLALYGNDTYGYSFYYPPEYTVRVASEDAITLGKTEAGGFVSYAQSRIATGTAAHKDYESFVSDAVRTLCQSIGCTTIAEEKAYTNDTDLAGRRYTVTLPNGAYGPVFAFNVGPNVPSARYAALLIYPPLEGGGTDGLLTPAELAAKVEITKVDQR